MRLKVFYIIAASIILGCTYNKRNKKYHTRTTEICPHLHLYVETYTVFAEGGATGGTMASDYLTDSVNFRIYVGTFEVGEENYLYQCEHDNIEVEKTKFEEDTKSFDGSKGTVTKLESRVYSLRELKAKKVFE